MKLHYIATPKPASPKPAKILVILVHGGALSSTMYHTLTPHLTMQSLAIDLPGHGKSHDSGPFTFKQSTALLKSLLEDLSHTDPYRDLRIVLVGVSLGGQAVLDFLTTWSGIAVGAIVSGVSIRPPDNKAGFELPHMPTDPAWLALMKHDIDIMGHDAALALQKESFAWTFKGRRTRDEVHMPMLICVGEHDTAMAKRDFDVVVQEARAMNEDSEGMVIEGARHNHPIDIPEKFAGIINEWVTERFLRFDSS